jgi:N-acetylmuramoyl-L-alanine amidase
MDETMPARALIRTFALAGGVLAMLAACSTGGGGSSGSTTTVATTAFSTIPIQTTTVPDTAPGQGATGASGTSGTGGAAGGATYTVQSGDYLVGIAKKLGVPLQSLLDANGMTATSLITPGMKLKVPSATSSSSTTTKAGGTATTAAGGSSTSAAPTTTTTLPGAGGTYTVQPNDYWAGIAQKLGVNVDDLVAFNDATVNTVIHPGDKLKVPPKATTTTKKP